MAQWLSTAVGRVTWTWAQFVAIAILFISLCRKVSQVIVQCGYGLVGSADASTVTLAIDASTVDFGSAGRARVYFGDWSKRDAVTSGVLHNDYGTTNPQNGWVDVHVMTRGTTIN